ncbi:CU044_2847 family protein [Almyronema epifaneia]|uniref:CU044_2847 family protein n=1 Tax=Almyronema epifaneia S1 TaxID=2991925 RepID=A0ABW6IEK7_9CYAN
MTQLVPITLEDGTIIFMEATEDVAPPFEAIAQPEGATRVEKGINERMAKNFQAIRGTIRAYTVHTLDAFQNLSQANVDKVTLEFGVKVAGEAGVPYVTQGTAECNLKITVECTFPPSSPQPTPPTLS